MRSVLAMILLATSSLALAQPPAPPPMQHAPIGRHAKPVKPVKPGNSWINPNQLTPDTPVLPPLPNIGPIPQPAPTPSGPTDIISAIINAVAEAQQKILSDLSDANTMASAIRTQPVPNRCMGVFTPATPTTPAACNPPEQWDWLGAQCFPAMSTFIASIPGAGTIPSVPQGGGGLISAAEEVRLLDLAAKDFIANIKSIGYPDTLKAACSGWMLDYVTQVNIDLSAFSGVGLMNGLFLKFIPMPMAEKHGLGELKTKLKLQ